MRYNQGIMKRKIDYITRNISFRDFTLTLFGRKKYGKFFQEVMNVLRLRKSKFQECVDNQNYSPIKEVALVIAEEYRDLKASPQRKYFPKNNAMLPVSAHMVTFKGKGPFHEVTNSPIYLVFHKSMTTGCKVKEKAKVAAGVIIHEILHSIYRIKNESIADDIAGRLILPKK